MRKPKPHRVSGTCCGIISGWPPCYCSRVGHLLRDGKSYCRQHDPGDPEAIRLKRLARYQEEAQRQDRLEAESKRRRLEEEACRNLSNDELEDAIRCGGLKRPQHEEQDR